MTHDNPWQEEASHLRRKLEEETGRRIAALSALEDALELLRDTSVHPEALQNLEARAQRLRR